MARQKWQIGLLVLFGVALATLVWAGNVPSSVDLIEGVVIVLYVVGGLIALTIFAAAMYLGYRHALGWGGREVVRKSVLEEAWAKRLEATEALEAQRAVAEERRLIAEHQREEAEAQQRLAVE